MPSVSVKTTLVDGSVVFSDVNPANNGVQVDSQNTSNLLVEPNEEAYEITLELQDGVLFQNPAITFNTSPPTHIPPNSGDPSKCTLPDTNHLTSEDSPQMLSFTMHTSVGDIIFASLPNAETDDPTIVNNPPPGG